MAEEVNATARLKKCSACNELLPISAFVRNADSPDGYHSRCQPCKKAINRERRYIEQERTSDTRCTSCDTVKPLSAFSPKQKFARYPSCRACRSAASYARVKSMKEREPAKYRIRNMRSYLKSFHGMTLEQYMDQYRAQGGVCALCGLKSKEGRKLVVDHDHHSGKWRGLLCDRCNLGLGMFDDSEKRMTDAAEYLRIGGVMNG